MSSIILRKQLYTQIDSLPDDIVRQIAEFTSFLVARKNKTPDYIDWSDSEWQTFSLEQFFREDDEDIQSQEEEVLYTREDAIKVYHQ